jgi:hypothetical protein
MALRFKVGDKVKVREDAPGARPWWLGKEATVRAVYEQDAFYEVLFDDAADFAFIEDPALTLVRESRSK